jgi:FPC/CPF motif-containing protein YcgG
MYIAPLVTDHPMARDFRNFVADNAFPCVGAKAALGRNQIDVVIARSILSAWNDVAIYNRILCFVAQYRQNPAVFQSLIIIFEGPTRLTEAEFEKHLWQRLQSLSDKDKWSEQPYDPKVSSDPENPHFSLSFGGEAFFVVGLHPGASRIARRFKYPAMVLNVHDQFLQLRDQDRYEGIREKILARDKELQGDLNPMLARHGETSEARQYSGRDVGEKWVCPFSTDIRGRVSKKAEFRSETSNDN